MKLILQRVLSSSVTVEGRVVGSIGPGLIVYLGISREDTMEKIPKAANKILNIRLWHNGPRTWDQSVVNKEYEVLIVSQFTLLSVLKGNKPDFHNAMAPEQALSFYEALIAELKKNYVPERIQNGAFGEYMNINSVVDGPVTIELNY